MPFRELTVKEKLERYSGKHVEDMLRYLIRNGEISDYDDEIANRIKEAAELCATVRDVMANSSTLQKAFEVYHASAAPLSESDRQAALSAMRGMLAEFEKMTRYGSPLAHAANENVLRCRAAIAMLEERGS